MARFRLRKAGGGSTLRGGDTLRPPEYARSSLASTWTGYPGGKPGIGDDLVVNATNLPSGLMLDEDIEWGTLTVEAGSDCVFDPEKSVLVELTGNAVIEGRLRSAPESRSLTHELRFININEALFVGGGTTPLATDVGLWVTGSGVLDFSGPEVTPWVRASGDIELNDTVITLDSTPVGWQAGDELVFTPMGAGQNPHLESKYDRITIASISGANVTLSSGLTVDHLSEVYNGVTYTAEVLNLNRSIIVAGAASARTHVLIHSIAAHTIDYVEIKHFGPRPVTDGIQGRYGMHFHAGGTFPVEQQVIGCSLHDGGFHAYVAHKSHNVRYTSCVSHDTQDDAFWWDESNFPVEAPVDNSTDKIKWIDCVASLVREGNPGSANQNTGFALGKGDDCETIGCVAVGVYGGKSSSGFKWAEKQGVVNTPWVFQDCIAHNNEQSGIFWWQNNSHPSPIVDFVTFDNGGGGILLGAYRNGVLVTRVTSFQNNEAGLVSHAHGSEVQGAPLPQIWTDCIFDGGTKPAIIKEPSSATDAPAGPIQFNNCKLISTGTAVVELLHRNNVDQPDSMTFAASTEFLVALGGADALIEDWFIIEDGSHVDLLLTKFGTTNYTIYEETNVLGTFYAPWNAAVDPAIAAAVTKEQTIQYDVLDAVTEEQTIQYDVLDAVTKEQTIQYDVLAPVSKEATIQYDVLDAPGVPVVKIQTIQYNVAFPASMRNKSVTSSPTERTIASSPTKRTITSPMQNFKTMADIPVPQRTISTPLDN